MQNQELVTLADSQLLRTVRDITNSEYNAFLVTDLIKRKKQLSKKKNNKASRQDVLEITNKIDTLLFVPELVSVSFSDKRHADKLFEKDGFTLNGKKYIPFMASSGMIRRNTMLFIDKDIQSEVDRRFNNGRNENIEMVSVKYGVYYRNHF